MAVELTERERATILAALRRWLSYPAARAADSIATNGGKDKPLDDGEIQGLCKRISQIAKRDDAAPLGRNSNNGAGIQKYQKLRDDQLEPRNLTTRENRPSIRASGLQRRSRPTRG